MALLHAPIALLPDGWHREVRMQVGPHGNLLEVTPGARPDPAARRLKGPVLPGVPNVHSHAFQRGMAGWAEAPPAAPHRGGHGPGSGLRGGGLRAGPSRGLGRGSRGHPPHAPANFWEWREIMYRFAAAVTPDEMEAIALHLYVEMLQAGYTSVGEFHYLQNAPGGEPYELRSLTARRLLSAACRAGVGITLLPAVYLTADFGGESPLPGQLPFLLDPQGLGRVLEELAHDFRETPDARGGVALHSLRAVPPPMLEEALAVREAFLPGGPVHLHIAEQRREVAACLSWSGARPVEWLLDNAPVGPDWCLVHCTHATPDELQGVARSGAVVGICPTTEANLGDGIFPLHPYLAARGALAIGSDSHVSVSPVEELRWLEYGQRLLREERNVAAGAGRPRGDPGGPARSTGGSLFRMAVSGGSRALGRPVGRLEAGSRSDLVVLDGDDPELDGLADDRILDLVLFSGNRSRVREVMVGGRWVVEEGRHPLAEEAAVGFREAVRGLRARV